jgi:hypothetical protein
MMMRNELCASIMAITELHLEALGNNPQFSPEMALAILRPGGSALLQHPPSANREEFMTSFHTVNSTPPPPRYPSHRRSSPHERDHPPCACTSLH